MKGDLRPVWCAAWPASMAVIRTNRRLRWPGGWDGSKRADLAGPGIGDYDEIDRVLPVGYQSLLTPRETQRAIFAVKDYIERGLCRELNPQMVTVPLILDADSGVNDMLDRDGSRTPVGAQRPA